MYSIAPNREDFAFDETWSTLLRSKLSCWVGNLVQFWVCLIDVVLRDEFPRTWSLVLLNYLVWWRMKHFKNQIPKIKSWNSIHAWTCIERNNFSFFWTVWNWCLFLALQLVGTNVWLPTMHNVPPDVDFESSRSPAKSKSWNSPNLHCLAVFPSWQYCLGSHVRWL